MAMDVIATKKAGVGLISAESLGVVHAQILPKTRVMVLTLTSRHLNEDG